MIPYCTGRKWAGFSRTYWCVLTEDHEGLCRTQTGYEFEPMKDTRTGRVG